MKKIAIQPENLIEEIRKIQDYKNAIFHISNEVLKEFVKRNEYDWNSDYKFGCHSIKGSEGIIGYESILKAKFAVITRVSSIEYTIPDISNVEEIYVFI